MLMRFCLAGALCVLGMSESIAACTPRTPYAIGGYMPMNWYYGKIIIGNGTNLDDRFYYLGSLAINNCAGQLGVADKTVWGELQLDNDPLIDFDDLQAQLNPQLLPKVGTFVYVTEGISTTSAPGGFCIETFIDPAQATSRRNALVAAHGAGTFALVDLTASFAQDAGTSTVWAVYITDAGISSLLQMPAGGILIAGNCYGTQRQPAWGMSADGCYVSSDVTCGSWSLCKYVEDAFSYLGCRWAPLFLQSDVAATNPSSYDLQATGNTNNRVNCAVGCTNLVATFLASGAFDRTVWWRAGDEDPETTYVVRAHSSWGAWASVDTLAVVRGLGTEGEGRLRTYAVPVSNVGAYGEVIARDGRGRVSNSRRFLWTERPPELDYWLSENDTPLSPGERGVAGNMFEMKDGELFPVGVHVNARASTDQLPTLTTPCDGCADVVVYSSNSTFVPPVESHVHSYHTEGGANLLKVRSFVGGTDAAGVSAVLQSVREANIAWNAECDGCGRTYPGLVGPTLVIVGDSSPLVVGVESFPDDEYNTCALSTDCYSYFDIADFDHDGKPECPVQIIPANTIAEVQRAVAAADDWNAGRFVQNQGRLGMFCGDELGTASPPMVEQMQRVADGYAADGQPNAPMLVESQVPLSQRIGAGASLVNSGIRDLWVEGLATNPWGWTDFMRSLSQQYEVGQLTTKQRVMVFAPGCQTGANWVPETGNSDPPLVEQLMFNDPGKTVAVGCVGHLNGDWDIGHGAFADRLLSKLRSAPTGRTMARVVFDAVAAMCDAGESRYARGVVFHGAHVKVRDDSDPTWVESEGVSAPVEDYTFTAVPNPVVNSVELRYSTRHGAAVTVQVFDASGRAVRVVFAGNVEAGVHVSTWNGRDERGRDVGSGVYFGTVSIDGRRLTQKFTLVR